MTAPLIEVTPSVEIFDLAVRYLTGDLRLHDLEEWLAHHTRYFMTAPQDAGTELAGLVELNLAELSARHASEEDLRDDLRVFLANHPTIHSRVPQLRIESTSTVIPFHLTYQAVLIDTRSVGASG